MLVANRRRAYLDPHKKDADRNHGRRLFIYYKHAGEGARATLSRGPSFYGSRMLFWPTLTRTYLSGGIHGRFAP